VVKIGSVQLLSRIHRLRSLSLDGQQILTLTSARQLVNPLPLCPSDGLFWPADIRRVQHVNGLYYLLALHPDTVPPFERVSKHYG